MTLLETLRMKNPGLRLYSVRDAVFEKYGCVIDDYDTGALCESCKSLLSMPESGSKYEPALDGLTGTADDAAMSGRFFGQTPAQTGICYGFNTKFNALEYHRSSEINVAVTPLVLMLGDRRDVKNARYDSAQVEAFLLDEGDIVEVYATTLHYCPCQVSDAGFICVVGLPRDTNTPLKAPHGESGEERLLYAANKWLLCHEDASGLVQKGVHPGIYGENYELKY